MSTRRLFSESFFLTYFFNLGRVAESLHEGLVREEAVLVLGITELLQQFGRVLLGDLIGQVGEDVLQLGEHHGAVLVLVVELAQLDVVVSGALAVLGLLRLVNEFDDVVELGELFVAFIGLAETDANLLGDVKVQGVDDVAEEEHVEFAFAIPVVDVANLFDRVGVGKSHLELFLATLFENETTCDG